MKVKNIIIAQDRYSILGGITTVNKLLGHAFDEAGYNVSYMALFDNTAGHPDAIEPDFEGLPMSFLEAMQVGTPLISYPSSWALQEMVPEVGYLAAEPSVEALQEQMRLAMSDAQLRAQKSALCLEKSRTFSPEYVVRHWEKLFESIHR